MAKINSLTQDIARLFVKYDLEDWRELLGSLTKGGVRFKEISAAIESLAVERQRLRPKSGSDRKKLSTASLLPADVNPGRRDVLEVVEEEFRSNPKATGLARIRDAYYRIGGKEPLPKKRVDAARLFILQLSRLPDDIFPDAVEAFLSQTLDPKGEYSLWFDMIYDPSARDKKI